MSAWRGQDLKLIPVWTVKESLTDSPCVNGLLKDRPRGYPERSARQAPPIPQKPQ